MQLRIPIYNMGYAKCDATSILNGESEPMQNLKRDDDEFRDSGYCPLENSRNMSCKALTSLR